MTLTQRQLDVLNHVVEDGQALTISGLGKTMDIYGDGTGNSYTFFSVSLIG